MQETKEQVIEKILEDAEYRPWNVTSLIYSKLPVILMRTRKLTYDQAMDITRATVQNLGTLDDDMDIEKVRSMLLTRIDISE